MRAHTGSGFGCDASGVPYLMLGLDDWFWEFGPPELLKKRNPITK